MTPRSHAQQQAASHTRARPNMPSSLILPYTVLSPPPPLLLSRRMMRPESKAMHTCALSALGLVEMQSRPRAMEVAAAISAVALKADVLLEQVSSARLDAGNYTQGSRFYQ